MRQTDLNSAPRIACRLSKNSLWSLVLVLPLLIGQGATLAAEMCAHEPTPAATLLLPYFEVDLTDDKSPTTLFSLNNASAEPALAHVTFWTDWSQPTFDFDIFLTGYDVVTVRMDDVFNGIVPITADDQNDPLDDISPHGGNAIWDGDFPGCENTFPFGPPNTPLLSQNLLTRLRLGHSGGDPFGLGCMGETYDDTIARGYITIDSVSRCSTLFANESGYFIDGGQGVANNNNVLWGDYFIINLEEGFAFGEPLVSVEAQDGFNGAVPGYTFYGRYDPALTGSDNREPLGTAWATRYITSSAFDGGTDLIVWRDSTTTDVQEFYGCGEGPSWRPLNEIEVVAFNEEEDAVELCFSRGFNVFSPPDPDVDVPCFPLETQRIPIGVGDLTTPFEVGWMFMNLNIDDVGVDFDVDFGNQGILAQSYVTTVMSALGRFQVGFSAFELADACNDVSPSIVGGANIPTLASPP